MSVAGEAFLNREFKLLFERIFPPLQMYCNSFLHDFEKAEDIVQNSFMKLWMSDLELTNENRVKAFLYQTVKNECLNEIRHSKVESIYSDHQKAYTDAVFNDGIIKQETYEMVYKTIELLAPQTRRVILLTLKGYGYKEIAEELNVSVNTVKLLKRNGMKKLKGLLKDYYYVVFSLLSLSCNIFFEK